MSTSELEKVSSKEVKKEDRGVIISRYGTVFVMAAVFIIFVIISDRFSSPDNLVNLLKQASIMIIVAMGITIAMAAGEFDMSTGNVASLSNVVCAYMMVFKGWSAPQAILLAIVLGVAIGLFNGFVTVKLRIPSIIVTLGMSTVILGIVYVITDGKSIYGAKISRDLINFAVGSLGPISNLTVVAIIFVVFTFLFLNRMIIGRHIYAIGGNMKAAKMSGINTDRIRILSMVICSTFSAVAGVLLVGRMSAGTMGAGVSYTLEGISAVFIGMTCIRLGRSNVIGTIVGVFLTYFLINGLTMMGVNTYYQNIVSGFVMIGAIALTASRTELKFFGAA